MSGKWKRYPAYRESGVEWLGKIPEHWAICPLKRASQCLDGKRIPLNSTERAEMRGDYPYWGANSVVDHVADWLFDEELVLLGEDGAPFFDKSKAVAFFVSGKIWVNNHAHVLRARPAISPRFLARLLNVVDYEAFIDGSTRDKLTQDAMRSIPVQCPPIAEQHAIAAFLDRETAKIDALVAKKERLIELLQEKRTALISHAVTRGLNPNAPLRDSGIPWLGHIPQHWRTRRLAMVTSKITNGFVGPTRDILVDEGIRYLQSLHIKDGSIRFNTTYFVRPQWSADHAKSILAEGDVLIVQTGDLGQCAAVPRDFVGANCHALIIVRLRPDVGSGRFLSAFLRSHYGRASLRCCETGATLPHLECGKIREIQIALPPEDEQDQIMNELEAMTAKLDALKAKIRTAIDRLQEYRTAMISAAVTGQIDVREEARP